VGALAGPTTRTAALFATGRMAGALCPGRVITLAERVLNLMWMEKMKTLVSIMVACCAIGGGALVFGAAGRPGSNPVEVKGGPQLVERVDVTEGKGAIRAGKEYGARGKEVTNSIGMKLVLIPKGKFTMGSPREETGREEDEPQHEVNLTAPFYMGAYEVTQGQYEKVMGKNPSFFSEAGPGRGKDAVKGMDTADFPVERVSWEDAVEFCKRLSGLAEEEAAGRAYRLPMEAEWEYACRAGEATPFHPGNTLTPQQANISRSGGLKRTCRVGSYKPNAWGLYDMHGNVGEWCSDWYDKDYYKGSPGQDPKGPAKGSDFGLGLVRVERGGSWFDSDGNCRAACRGWAPIDGGNNTIGFRVVATASGTGEELPTGVSGGEGLPKAADTKEAKPELPAPGEGAQPPVTKERLIGSTLAYHRTPPDEIVWEFSRGRFTLRVKGTPAPADLFDPLLGKGKTAEKIEGAWKLSADNKYLELSEITGDGRAGEKSARLPISPTGAIRVTIGERQYNVIAK
jgi:formylglycine-generating enzyme required for sulfatase activity